MPMEWIDRLFMRLSAMYGQKFASQWAGTDVGFMKGAWADDLGCMTGQDIATGLEACKSRPFPPTLPEFIVLCRPGMDPAIAHAEAVLGMQERKRGNLGEWSHPAVYWAAVHVGAHDLLNQGFAAIRGRWEKVLRDSWKKGQWEPVPMPAVALPAPGQDVTSKEEGQKRVQKMAEQALISGRDPLLWAKKILSNPKGRSALVLSMAKTAMEGRA